jgi:alkylation response protein AidB-like acyl-CoA dehydrogenase
VLIDEDLGGLGWGYGEAAIVLSELGRLCVPVPFVGTAILAPVALKAVPRTAQTEMLCRELAAGKRTATVALPSLDADIDVEAEFIDDQWFLHGTVSSVLDLPHADVVLVPVRTTDGVALFAVDVRTPGVSVTEQPTVDTTRDLGTLHMNDVTLSLSAALAGGTLVSDSVLAAQDALAFSLACDAAAGAARVHEMTLDYAQQRHQFGRPIGAFQVVKHRLADQHLGSERAEVSIETAAAALGGPAGALSVSTAKAVSTDAYARIAHDAVLLHGAIGFTWEHDLHIYLKRALLDRELGGTPPWHRLRALALREASTASRHGEVSDRGVSERADSSARVRS